jgi:hypothetical protein
MPKRVVDGEGVWLSDKIAKLPPASKAEYTNLLPLALANGVFECSPRLVWSRVYSYNRPEVTETQVGELLSDLERARLLFRWTDEHGKTWGYWVGIEKPGRLPSESRKNRKHERTGPNPPEEQLAAFLAVMDSTQQEHGQPMASQRLTNGEVGFGFGTGFGFGKNPSSEVSPSDAQPIATAPKENPKEASPSANRLAALLSAEIHRNKADYRITPAQLRNWAKTADLMLRRDERAEEQIANLIRWVQRDQFWHKNILSMDKLREKFDQLEMKRQCETPNRSTNVDPEITPSQRLEMRKVATAGGVH